MADDLASGHLVSWGTISARPTELWALHASTRLASAKIRAFLLALESAFPEDWL